MWMLHCGCWTWLWILQQGFKSSWDQLMDIGGASALPCQAYVFVIFLSYAHPHVLSVALAGWCVAGDDEVSICAASGEGAAQPSAAGHETHVAQNPHRALPGLVPENQRRMNLQPGFLECSGGSVFKIRPFWGWLGSGWELKFRDTQIHFYIGVRSSTWHDEIRPTTYHSMIRQAWQGIWGSEVKLGGQLLHGEAVIWKF